MLNDPLVALMVMLLLCFIGMLVMFLFVIRSVSGHTAAMREGFRQQQAALADLELRLTDLSLQFRSGGRHGSAPAESAPAAEDLGALLSGIGAGGSAASLSLPDSFESLPSSVAGTPAGLDLKWDK